MLGAGEGTGDGTNEIQTEAPLSEYVPATQLEQIDADAIEYEPAAQAPVTAVRPVVAQ